MNKTRSTREYLGWFMAVCAFGLLVSSIMDGDLGVVEAAIRGSFVGALVYQWRKDRQIIGADLVDNWFFMAVAAITMFL